MKEKELEDRFSGFLEGIFGRLMALGLTALFTVVSSGVASAQNYVVTRLAGSSAGASGSDDGPGAAARFSRPWGVAIDAGSVVYIADSANQTIRKIAPGGIVTTLAGLAGVSGSVDGAGSSARFNSPRGLAADASGNLYVADAGNHTIRKLSPGGIVTTLAGLAGTPGSVDGTGNSARFNFPSGVGTDSAGNVYVADVSNHTIRKITPGGVVTTLAGLGGNFGSANGVGNAARFYFPYGVTVGAGGNLFVADGSNNMIRMITPAGVVTTLAGATTPGTADGTGSAARFSLPTGIVADQSGTLFVTDYGNHRIRRVSSGGVVTTVAGTSFGLANGSGAGALFSYPMALAVDPGGTLFLSEYVGQAIRRLDVLLPLPGGRYDSDGRADPTVYRHGAIAGYGAWFLQQSVAGPAGYLWGVPGDIPVPADYDGDGRTDLAIFRASAGQWWIVRSSLGTAILTWGGAGDIPVPADYDGDGKADVAVYRPATGTWFIVRSSTGVATSTQWGTAGDTPVPADYDGDGKTDVAIFRPSTGTWFIVPSSTGVAFSVVWGAAGDVPMVGDFDGDGKADPTVFRPLAGTWFQLRSTTGTGVGVVWGVRSDLPIVGDYDGDGKADVTVFRPETGIWYHILSSTGLGSSHEWGTAGDLPK